MVDLNQTYLMEQQSLLREIRDELRTGRMVSGPGGGGPSAAAMGPSRPSPAYLSARNTADQMIAGEWMSFGWTQAYRPQIESSLLNDWMATRGLRRAPNTMTQLEFQQVSDQLLWQGLGRLPGRVLTPGFTRRIDAMQADVMSAMQRSMRAGDAGVGVFGTGVDPLAARGLARRWQVEAATDLRMNAEDYSTVFQTGMRSGQFDFTPVSELSQKFKELRDTTADLTRMTRMSVQEISQAMGSLRQFGVIDVADQGRILTQIDAAARVAGVSGAEMAPVVQRAMGRGAGLGIAAETSAVMASGNLASLRGLTRAGVLGPHIVAAGGGLQNIEGAITAAQQNFVSSDLGMMAIMGGLGRGGGPDLFQGMQRTLGAMGGMPGYMAFQANRLDLMQQMTRDPDRMRMAYQQGVEYQLRMMGIQDPMSEQGRNAAYMLLQGQMGAPAAMAYVRENFTPQGLAMRDHSRMAAIEYENSRQQQMAHDRMWMESSPRASWMRGWRRLVSAPGRWMAQLEEGILGGQAASAYERQASAISMGAAGDAASPVALARALTAARGDPAAAAALDLPSSGDIVFARTDTWDAENMTSGALAMGGMGAAVGTMIAPGVGTVIGGVAGLALGAFIGSTAEKRVEHARLSGSDATDYVRFAHAVGSRQAGDRRRVDALIKGASTKKKNFSGILQNSTAQQLMRGDMDQTGLDYTRSLELQKKFTQIAKETGENVGDVVDYFRAHGMQIELTKAVEMPVVTDAELDTQLKDISTALGPDASVNLATGVAARTMHRYLTARQAAEGGGAEDAAELAAARREMQDVVGGPAKVQTMLWKRFSALGDAGRQSFLAALEARDEGAGRRVLNRRLGTARMFAESLLVGPGYEAERDMLGDMSNLEFLAALAGEDEADPKGRALRAALQDSDSIVLRDAMRIGQMDTSKLLRADPTRLARQFQTLEASTVEALQQAVKDGKIQEDDFKQVLAATVLDTSTVRRVEGEGMQEVKVANLLHQTSQVLDRMMTNLGLHKGSAEGTN